MQVNDAHDIDVVMSMYSLKEYSDNCSKTSGTLWQSCRDELALPDNVTLLILMQIMCSSFNFEIKITGETGNNGTKNVEIMVPLKYLSTFWRTLEILLCVYV